MLPHRTRAMVIVSVLIPGDTELKSPHFGAGSGVSGNRRHLIGERNIGELA